jgi:hypothetical protein
MRSGEGWVFVVGVVVIRDVREVIEVAEGGLAIVE